MKLRRSPSLILALVLVALFCTGSSSQQVGVLAAGSPAPNRGLMSESVIKVILTTVFRGKKNEIQKSLSRLKHDYEEFLTYFLESRICDGEMAEKCRNWILNERKVLQSEHWTAPEFIYEAAAFQGSLATYNLVKFINFSKEAKCNITMQLAVDLDRAKLRHSEYSEACSR